MDKDKKVIIFDFDGVFVSNFDFHRKHIENFLEIKFSDEEFYNIHSGNVYANDGLGLEKFDPIEYCKKIKEELIQLPIVEGMGDVIQQVQMLGQSFIVSSGCRENIHSFFVNNGICENICTIYGVETSPSKEEKFAKILNDTGVNSDNVIFVTDTLGDLNEANALGISSIAVTWGFQRAETLQKGSPFGFANSSGDIVELIKKFF